MSEWTKKAPTEPGYWFWRPLREPGLRQVAYLGKDDYFSYMACGAANQIIVHAEPKEWWTTKIEEPK